MISLPSKDLLCSVLADEIGNNRFYLASEFSVKDNMLIYGHTTYYDNDNICSVNIYEFAYLCKKWAFNNGDSMKTMCDLVVTTKNAIDYRCDVVDSCGEGDIVFTTYGDSEVQVIVWACQRILDMGTHK